MDGLKDRGVRGQGGNTSPGGGASPSGSPRSHGPLGTANQAPFSLQMPPQRPSRNSSLERLPGGGGPHSRSGRSPLHAVYAVGSMVLLALQCTAMSVVLRYSRTQEGRKYLSSVAVLLTEATKLVICAAVQLWIRRRDPPPPCPAAPAVPTAAQGRLSGDVVLKMQHPDFSEEVSLLATHHQQQQQQHGELRQQQQRGQSRPHRQQQQQLASELAAHFHHAVPMALPAAMFVFQQVLLIAAATHLDAVTYQIFNQAFKLVPTAVFAYLLLGQQLAPVQWASFPVLTAGVILVTVNTSAGAAREPDSPVTRSNWLAGMAACAVSGLSSAYAGVYFERYVKGKLAASLWVRNVQLGLFGVPFSAAWAWARDGAAIREHGWLQGFSRSTYLVIALQVFGGLVIGMVVKYCDNVMKNFVLAISVILTVLVAIPLFGQWPSAFFLVGVALVLLSVFLYGRVLETQRTRQWAAAAQRAW